MNVSFDFVVVAVVKLLRKGLGSKTYKHLNTPAFLPTCVCCWWWIIALEEAIGFCACSFFCFVFLHFLAPESFDSTLTYIYFFVF